MSKKGKDEPSKPDIQEIEKMKEQHKKILDTFTEDEKKKQKEVKTAEKELN